MSCPYIPPLGLVVSYRIVLLADERLLQSIVDTSFCTRSLANPYLLFSFIHSSSYPLVQNWSHYAPFDSFSFLAGSSLAYIRSGSSWHTLPSIDIKCRSSLWSIPILLWLVNINSIQDRGTTCRCRCRCCSGGIGCCSLDCCCAWMSKTARWQSFAAQIQNGLFLSLLRASSCVCGDKGWKWIWRSSGSWGGCWD